MKKKNLKPIVISALLAVGFGASTVGTSFALFTDKADTSIQVTAGIVDVHSKIELVNYQSTVEGEKVTTLTPEGYTNPLTGSSFTISGQEVTISKMVPGDKLTVKVTNTNKSNVKTKTRFVSSHNTVTGKKDLFPALALGMSAKDADDQTIANPSAWMDTDIAENTATGDTISVVTVTIEFVDHNQGILAREDGTDNPYQDAACTINFSQQAVQGNAAIDPIDIINSYLAQEDFKGNGNNTMHDALADVKALGYTTTTLAGYVWSVEYDQFVATSAVAQGEEYKYFKLYESMPTAQDYSIYALGDTWVSTTAVNLNGVGFDAGDNVFSAVNYVNEGTAKNVVIRTNSANTTLTIDDATTGTIYHYGNAGALNIIQVHTSSYHENGSVAFAEIAKGRVVLENGSEIKHIHIDKKANEEAFDTIIITDKGAKTLPEAITRDKVDVDVAKPVVTVESGSASETVYVYPYTDAQEDKTGTTEQTSTQNTYIATDLGKLVLDNGQDAGEKAMSNNEKAETKTAIVEETIVVEEADKKACYVGDVAYDTLNDAIAAASDGVKTEIKVNKLVIIKGNAGINIPVNKDIVIDLNGYTVKNQVNENKASQIFDNNGTLTIKDSSDTLKNGTGTGLLINGIEPGTQPGEWWSTPQYNYATNVIANKGTLNIESGKLMQTALSSICYVVDNNSTNRNVTLNINGGLLTSSVTSVRMFANSTTYENTLNMTAGAITTTGYSAVWVQLPGSSGQKKKATLSITGGTLTGKTCSFYDYSYGDLYDNVQYNLSGGTFNGMIFSYGANFDIKGGTFNGEVAIKQTKASNVTVSGGTFASDVYTYGDNASTHFISGGIFLAKTYQYEGQTYDYNWVRLIAEGYSIIENQDGTFKVSKN